MNIDHDFSCTMILKQVFRRQKLQVCWNEQVICSNLMQMEELERDGLVEKWQGLASPFNMHELYFEFAKKEVVENFTNHYLYYEGGPGHESIKRFFFRMSWFQGQETRRVHIYKSGVTELSLGLLEDRSRNIEVLKLDFCFQLVSLDLRCLRRLRSLELRGCLLLQEIKGLEDLECLEFIRWIPLQNFELLDEIREGFYDHEVSRMENMVHLEDSDSDEYAHQRFNRLLNRKEVLRRGCELFRYFSKFPLEFTLGLMYGSKGLDALDDEFRVVYGSKHSETRDTGSLRPAQ